MASWCDYDSGLSEIAIRPVLNTATREDNSCFWKSEKPCRRSSSEVGSLKKNFEVAMVLASIAQAAFRYKIASQL
jgi:hypothetical protein